MVRKLLEKFNRRAAEAERLLKDANAVPYRKVRDLIRNPETFAQPIDPFREELGNDVVLEGETVTLEGAHFTNRYTLSYPISGTLQTRISTRNRPLFMHRLLKNEPKLLAAINGPFFCLHDGDPTRYPQEIIYHANVREGAIFGLPSADRPLLYTDRKGRLHAQDVRARGTVHIDNVTLRWQGGESVAHNPHLFTAAEQDKGHTYLFNAACCTIAYQDPNNKTSLRLLDEEKNHTPRNPHKTDVVITTREGIPRISALTPGGGTDFFEGHFILQVPLGAAQSFSLGQPVQLGDLDGLPLADIVSAVSTGPLATHFLVHDDHPINHDPSLGTFPPFAPDRRYARSLIYEKKGRIHFVVFDGVPRSQHMQGVTPKEAAQHIPQDIAWALFLDGGQSSRISFRRPDGNIGGVGNKQYLRLHLADKTAQAPMSEERFLWTRRGRPTNATVEVLTTP